MENMNDPYFYRALQSLAGRDIAVQTVRGSVRGRLCSVLPDHVLVQSGGAPFFIRTQQIIWAVPISAKQRMYKPPSFGEFVEGN
ncbi:YuzF family protein [Paenactinomyces guangxiensis]|uniref:YuzF family protein n=2 Tax=Paenactinomyces guangxiensis TaxID=1490290 RepID=A0A7W2A7Z4_9BACL|nr:YuzF family protein [Paenactinomyces guangxiensis]MBA4495046.1 YuzF family protein [Paenactinomyces guangxiensis]MBH8592130.1 YuzF family protein [Paenactinomyces guangxiensis]